MRFTWAVVLVALSALPAQAAVFTFDTFTGDPAAGWTVDRYAPATFADGQTGGGRNGVLHHGISSADAEASRPSGFGSAFYNTQGRSHVMAPGTNFLSIELYIPAVWDGLVQNSPSTGATSVGRLAGLWGVNQTAAAFPILEFNNDTDGAGGASPNGFRFWDSDTGIWTNVGGFTAFDQWYELAIRFDSGAFNFYVDGLLVGSDTGAAASATIDFSRVILQGYNAGNSYDIYWDNFVEANVPEPASMLAWAGLGLCLAGGRKWRKRKLAA